MESFRKDGRKDMGRTSCRTLNASVSCVSMALPVKLP
jgi:hypothetical protein